MNDPIWIERRAEVEVASAVAAVKRGPEAGRPLAGLTLAIKDNIDVEGFVTTAGCPSYAYRPSRSATAVRRLQDAGAVIVGKTNLDQFATGLVGTRSPYGVVENPLRPGLIAGGSSSGSAAAVACRAADIGVGTDTAGSGRVPAALCGLVGLKGTPGLVPTTGVVPACPSFDCTTVMASDLAVAVAALRTMAGTDRDDPRSRPAPTGPAPLVTRVGIPSPETLIGCSDEVLAVHEAAIDGLRRTGLTVQTVGVETLSPYFAAGALLYGGAFVAERAAAVGAFIASGPPGLDPTVSAIIADGEGLTAVDYARDRDTLAALAAAAGRLWQEVDALLLPTVPRHPSIAEVRAEPVAVNAELGRFVSGANLVDWCAAVVPIEAAGISLGVQLLGPAWSDESLWRTAALMLGTEAPGPSEAVGQISIAVVGAHLSGEPLNHQLTDRGARLLRTTRTADAYRMVLLDGPVAKPGLLRDSTTSASFEVEVWELDAAGFGTFVDEIPGPLAIGTVELQDGSTVNGFVCEGEAAAHAADISVHGGWRAWLAST